MADYYLAVDIGASSGRHILGHMENGQMILEEIYRFENKLVTKNGHLCWELDSLFQEIKNGMKACKVCGKVPISMGIDTWGVDFVLLDKQDQILGDTVSYRDSRTNGIDTEVYQWISEQELYARTGIQKQLFNSIYQLYAIKKEHPEYLEQAEHFLMIPEYFNFLLTGIKKNEYTNATTGQLVNAVTKDWDREIFEKLGYKKEWFGELCLPKTDVGFLREEIQKEIGYNLKVVLPATHDTGSAVLSVPAEGEDFIYLSSGTWSLMGIERMEADCSPQSKTCNFTNEGGYDYRFRYLKNIMGLWMIQSIRRELNEQGKSYSFPDFIAMAKEADTFSALVDVNDARFLAPASMTEAIREYCRENQQPVPETIGETLACVYHSLAKSYQETVQEIETITQKTFSKLYIVGGGCQDSYLNQLTKQATQKEVFAGPIEGTAIGNLMVQMLRNKEFSSLEEARVCVGKSFAIQSVK
ncbi:MAG: rhamnulokinase [Lachnospiraceae bacterium]|nr:rhamnulokinase [Lachnospiraceae bacterium]